MKPRKRHSGTWIKAVVFVAAAAGLAAAQLEISRSTIDGGGVLRSAGGMLELSGTIGQPDAGVMTGGSLELNGGFWFETPAGDCNDDGTADLLDHGAFTQCLTGPAGPAAIDPCRCFDLDGSSRVDLADFSLIQILFTED